MKDSEEEFTKWEAKKRVVAKVRKDVKWWKALLRTLQAEDNKAASHGKIQPLSSVKDEVKKQRMHDGLVKMQVVFLSMFLH